jgi:hypothetical protein
MVAGTAVQEEEAQETTEATLPESAGAVFGEETPKEEAPPAPVIPDEEQIDLDRVMILGQKRRKLKRVHVPKWKGHVWIRDMGGVGRDQFEVMTTLQGDMNLHNARAKLLAVTLCNAEGEFLFSESDIEALGELDAESIAMLYNEASRLNFISDKDIEELAKNSARGASSTT